MADPLSLLREFVSSGRIDEVVVSGDRVDFGGKFTFSKNGATGYKSQQGKGNFYDLGTLLFFARNINSKFSEYFKKAREETGGAVTFVDRKDLQEYLTGRSDRSEYIQLAVLPSLEVEPPSKRARLEGGGAAGQAGPSGLGGVGEEEGEEAAEAAALRKVRENELQLRDRNSMLSVPGRSFRKVLTILSQAQRAQQLSKPLPPKQPAAKPVVPVRPSGRYERQTQQDATLKQLGAAELGVQVGFRPTSQLAAAAAAAAANGVPPPPPPPPEQQGAAPPPPPPPAVASSSRQQQQQHALRHAGGSGSSSRAAAAQQAGSRRVPTPKQPSAPKRQGTPVIMVPPGMTALLNMHNVPGFLERGEFQTTEQAKAAASAASASKPRPKGDRVAIQRTLGRKGPVKYYITDKEPANEQDWGRVVAVLCLGKAWQFKKWPFKGAGAGDMVETFSKVMGVYIHYTDEQVDATVKSWNVKILGINRQSRHRDATVAQEFWRLLDAHLQARSSMLLY